MEGARVGVSAASLRGGRFDIRSRRQRLADKRGGPWHHEQRGEQDGRTHEWTECTAVIDLVLFLSVVGHTHPTQKLLNIHTPVDSSGFPVRPSPAPGDKHRGSFCFCFSPFFPPLCLFAAFIHWTTHERAQRKKDRFFLNPKSLSSANIDSFLSCLSYVYTPSPATPARPWGTFFSLSYTTHTQTHKK